MAEISRSFKGIWIPREIWLTKKLSLQEKCLLAEIHSLDHPKTHCTASDEYLMEFLGLKRSRLQEILKKVRSLGLVSQVKFDGRVRTLKSHLNEKLDFLMDENEEIENQESGNQVSGIPESSNPESRKADIKVSIQEIENSNRNKCAKSHKKKADKPPLSEASHRLATSLLEQIRKRDPNFKTPAIRRWQEDIDKLIRIDGRSEEEIEEIIRWLSGSSKGALFWTQVVLSGQSLRKNFSKLVAAKNASKGHRLESDTYVDRGW